MVDRKRYDITASEDNPLAYATARRDSDVVSYLRTALEEKTALGRQIDCTALYLGLTELTKYPDLRLSINMSAGSIGYGQWVDILGRALRRDS